MWERTSYIKIWQELSAEKSMVFLAGPRQAGKTTLGEIICKSFTNHLYFNWDIAEHRTRFLRNPDFFEAVERKDTSKPLIVLDEIHKYTDWKNYLKGVYDRHRDAFLFLVSGSGRLDLYQRGGDSLAGRYFLFHLWPFTISELAGLQRGMEGFLADPLHMTMEGSGDRKEVWSSLADRSGFPEPYLSGKSTTYRRWSRTYSRQLVREDIRDLTGVKSVQEMETLYLLLPSRVGSPISIASLARDLKVSYNSVKSWLEVFERFFLTFSILPWTKKISRAVQKERKVYLWDSPRIEDPAARLENMVALELWRAVSAWNDLGHGTFSLHFVKNRDQQEVDFLLAEGGKPFLLIETKLSDPEPSAVFRRFQQALRVPAVQLVRDRESFRLLTNEGRSILVAPAYQYLSFLP